MRRQYKYDKSTVKKITEYIDKKSEIYEEKHAFDTLDNLTILTFFAILFPTILQFYKNIGTLQLLFIIAMFFFVIRCIFKGIAENSIKYRILVWMYFFIYSYQLFISTLLLYIPTEKWYTNLTEDGNMIYTHVYNEYRLIPLTSFVLIGSYLNSKFMTYIIRFYRLRRSSIEVIDSMEIIKIIYSLNDVRIFLIGLILLFISIILFFKNMLTL